ncbi:hypothetical protein [Ureaplasma zalophigenitalium]|uniref:Uncharacterized protein n=1 Tax=Ureaplasma zalophigenitalium TaxID=907723 RepID=A0ABT3BPJ3_9BACT|nr:hypothetical protein [Ureaplasma zalophigenitalium]MCV3754147.1 hypothetical protein [Ureaplasma zalophigenitalium]
MHVKLQRFFPVGKTLYEGEEKKALIKKYSDEKNPDLNNKFKILDEREFILTNMAKYQNDDSLLCLSSYELAPEKARFSAANDTLKRQVMKINIEDENFDMSMFDDQLSVDSLRLITLPEAYQNIDKIENRYPDPHNESKTDNEMPWWLKGSLSSSCTTECAATTPEHTVSFEHQDVIKNIHEQEICNNYCEEVNHAADNSLDDLINSYLTKETPIINPRATILDERTNILKNMDKYQSLREIESIEQSLTQALNEKESLSNQFKNSEEIISVLQPRNIQAEPTAQPVEKKFKNPKRKAKTWYVFETRTRN